LTDGPLSSILLCMPRVVPPRLTIRIEPSTGCDPCDDKGEVISDKLDAEGLWFKREQCANCNGTGHAVCAATACTSWANREVLMGNGPSYVTRSCCDNPACAREIVDLLMREHM
jgi:hypothetical protein